MRYRRRPVYRRFFNDKKFKPKPSTRSPHFFPRIIALAALTALFFLFIFISRLNFFAIKKVLIYPKNLSCVTGEKIINSSGLFGKNIWWVSEQEVFKKVQNKFQCISSLTLSRVIPNQVDLHLTERQATLLVAVYNDPNTKSELRPFVYTATQSGSIDASASAQFLPNPDFGVMPSSISARFIVDKEGVVFSREIDKYTLPKVMTNVPNLQLGSKIEKGLVANILDLLQNIEQLGLEVKSAKLLQSGHFLLVVQTKDGNLSKKEDQKLIFDMAGDYLRQVASLQLILQKSKIDSKVVESVDLRFDKPIVVYSGTKNGKR